jgi:hypothetical protein
MRALLPGIRGTDLRAAVALPPPGPTPVGLLSPWAPQGDLAKVIFSDIFGLEPSQLPLSRADAMAIPAMARARHIICGTIAQQTMRTYRGIPGTDAAEVIDPAPWINSTGSAMSPWHRAVWTVDDLIFYGWSCWSRTNGANGFPLRMDRLAIGTWSVEPGTGRVLVDRGDGVHEAVRQDSVVLIPGPHEGLLVFAQTTLRHAADLETAAAQAARTPAAHLVLKQTAGAPLPKSSDDPNVPTIDGLIGQWATARRGGNAGVAYLPPNLEAQELGTFSEHLLTEGRNLAAVNVARVASLPADLVDAAGEASLTYSNSRDNDRRAVDYGVGFYMGAITGRLSQDDVSPQGQRQAYDLEGWLATNVPGQDPNAVSPTPPQAPAPAGQSPVQPQEVAPTP